LALAYSTAFPKYIFLCAMTGFMIGITIKNWIGDPTRILLVGLAERLEKESEPAGAGQPDNPPVKL
jgi:hypothetical protein